ncbi:MAG: DNA-binding protein [Bacteroidales bacterium]|nr:DNA-binding protein [Bacteroidales bacterium]
MTEKKTFVLRIRTDTMKKIEKWAADEFRSINGQIEWMLNKCLKDHGRSGNR